MTEMTPEREQEIRNRRLDEVTAGPWLVADGVEGKPVVYTEGVGGGPGWVLFTAITASEADVQFVASARRSVPELLDEVSRLRELVAELEALTPAAIQTCRKCGAGYDLGQPCSACAFKALVAAATADRLGGDLPEGPLG